MRMLPIIGLASAFELRKVLKALDKFLKEAAVSSLLTESQAHAAGGNMFDDAWCVIGPFMTAWHAEQQRCNNLVR